MLKKYHLGLFFVIGLALFLRLNRLSVMPPALNWDEVSIGYNAYSILKTGRDEWGKLFPVIFRAYGDYKLPVYIYVTSLLSGIFGLNALSVRLPSAIAGTLTVLFTYLLVRELSFRSKLKDKSELLAFLSSLLVAVESWSLFLSRGAFEANLSLLFITSGLYFFIKSLSRAKFYLVLSMTLFGLSVWTYNSARVFVPILFIVLLILFKKELIEVHLKSRRSILMSLMILILFFVPMFIQLFNPVGLARYGKVSIIDAGAIGKIIDMRNGSRLPQYVSRLIYNRPLYFGYSFIKNWASHFSGKFLFFEGGTNYQFSIPKNGLIYPVNALFLLIGIFYVLKTRSKEFLLILTLFFFGVIPSALTREAPQVLRSITILPSPMIITAIGLVISFVWISKKSVFISKIAVLVYCLLLISSILSYLNTYFRVYRSKYSWSWQYGYKQVVEFSKLNYSNYDRIIITKKYGEPHEFFLFYLHWNPREYQNDKNLVRFNQSNWFWIDRFDKFYFVNDWDIPKEEWQPFITESKIVIDCKDIRCLLITSPGNNPKTWNKLETVNFLDGKKSFEIFSNSTE